MSTLSIDRHDLALLDALQRSGDATNALLGEAVHLSASQVGRRLQRLQEAGLITGYTALLDPAALGLDVIAFAHVVLERHGGVRTEAFEEGVAEGRQIHVLAARENAHHGAVEVRTRVQEEGLGLAGL